MGEGGVEGWGDGWREGMEGWRDGGTEACALHCSPGWYQGCKLTFFGFQGLPFFAFFLVFCIVRTKGYGKVWDEGMEACALHCSPFWTLPKNKGATYFSCVICFLQMQNMAWLLKIDVVFV